MPKPCEGNPFDLSNEDEQYRDLIGRLWGAFCSGVDGYGVDEKVVAKAEAMFKATSHANYKNGTFGNAGVEEAARRCCVATGRIARALAEMHENDAIQEGDFRRAAEFIQGMTHGLGAVC